MDNITHFLLSCATRFRVKYHGSGTSSSAEFLLAVQPSVALFQVGYRNRYRHPKLEVYERYGAMGIRRLRSDESGAVTLTLGAGPGIGISEYRLAHGRYWYDRQGVAGGADGD